MVIVVFRFFIVLFGLLQLLVDFVADATDIQPVSHAGILVSVTDSSQSHILLCI